MDGLRFLSLYDVNRFAYAAEGRVPSKAVLGRSVGYRSKAVQVAMSTHTPIPDLLAMPLNLLDSIVLDLNNLAAERDR